MPPATLQGLEIVFETVVISILSLGGIVLFLMFVSGGFKYLNSKGDPKMVESAQKTLTYAIGGFVMLAGSIIILKIIGDITGNQNAITDFKIFK